MKYYELKKNGEKRLLEAGIENAVYDALELLLYVTGETKVWFSVNQREEADENSAASYERMIEERAAHKPLQYITGSTGFYGYSFLCKEGVLIPRFDTEILVEQALRSAPARDLRVLDLCSGSGCIGITYYLERKKMGYSDHVVLGDISDIALSLSEQNAEALEACVEIRKTDLYSGLIGETYDIILSNPPYIPTQVIDTLTQEVKGHEPMLALDGDADGLAFYRRIIKEAKKYLNPQGQILMEIGYDQGDSVRQLLLEEQFVNIRVIQDLAGLDRVIAGCLE